MGLCADKVVLYPRGKREAYVLKQDSVHDALVYRGEGGKLVVELARKKEQVRSELELKMERCQTAEMREHTAVELVRSTGHVQYLIQNQAFRENAIVWNQLTPLAEKEFAK